MPTAIKSTSKLDSVKNVLLDSTLITLVIVFNRIPIVKILTFLYKDALSAMMGSTLMEIVIVWKVMKLVEIQTAKLSEIMSVSNVQKDLSSMVLEFASLLILHV